MKQSQVSKNIAKELLAINKIKALKKKLNELEAKSEKLLEWLKGGKETTQKVRKNLTKDIALELPYNTGREQAFKEIIEYIENQNK